MRAADTHDQRLLMERVAELVVHDVGDPRGVLAVAAGAEEVDRVARRVRVARVVDVDVHRKGLVEPRQRLRIDHRVQHVSGGSVAGEVPTYVRRDALSHR